MSAQRIARDVAELCARSVIENFNGLTEVEQRQVFELVMHHCLCAVEAFAIMVAREKQRLDPSSRN